MAEHHHAWSINQSDSADVHIATVLEGRFVGNRGKQPHSDVVEESRVPEDCLLQCLHGNSRWTRGAFSLIFGKHALEGLCSQCRFFIFYFYFFDVNHLL